MNAHHAFDNCGDVALGGSNVVDSWAETVFQCNDDIMTSINGTPGYAAIYLSPPAMADFSANSSTITFDVSTFIASARDWLDVLITPFAESMSYPFRSYRGAATFSSTIDIATAADLDNDGLWNELFMYDRDGMQWLVYRWIGFTPQLARAGMWTIGYDIALG